MPTRTGKFKGMSFYIGMTDEGYWADITIGKEIISNEVTHFHEAVSWVETLRREQVKQNETERSKEEGA